MEEQEKGLELSKRRRNGQTLVEFALTLPILLLLLFGIIEFGRIFQAWVTLQNSARAAARYATTGRYDPAYVINTNGADDENSVVPCIATATDERGVRAVYMPNNPSNYANHVDGFERGLEMLYATWYGGDDCNPEQDTDQNNRKDLLRLLSIIEEARVGAAGLAVGPISYLTTPLPVGDAYRNLTVDEWRNVPWFNVWDRPLPSGTVQNARLAGSDQPTWFDVMICSARYKLDVYNPSAFDETVFEQTAQLRFRTVRDAGDTFPGEDVVAAYAPACLLNEDGNDTYETNNGGHPWLDAGGPGDVVTIVITFNHPLVTPIGLASYLPLQARRTAVNEAFRTSRAANLGQVVPSGPGEVSETEPTPEPTPEETEPPTETPIPPGTEIPDIPTETPVPPFTCDGFGLAFFGWLPGGNGASFSIYNPNAQQTQLKRATIQWQTLTGWASLRVNEVRLGNGPLWNASDSNGAPTDIGETSSGVGADGPFLINANRYLPGNASQYLDVYFASGPSPLQSQYREDFFNGTTIYIDHPNQEADCVLNFSVPVPPPTTPPTNPTNTPIPDCLAGLIRVTFARFDDRGLVVWNIYNGRNVSATMVGFNLQWIQRTSNYTLDGVYAYSAPGTAGALQVWSSGNSNQDSTPPTVGHNGGGGGTEGVWHSNVTINAGQTIQLYVDFGGTLGRLDDSAMAARSSDYAGSTFEFNQPDCDPGSGTGGATEIAPVIIPQPTAFASPTSPPPPPPPPPSPPPSSPPPSSPPPTSPPPTSPPPTSPPPTSPPPTSPPPSGGPGGVGGSDSRPKDGL